ncbi:MAG: DUF2283 domain-containing protein [Candidatus Amesbacteria bacterium]|nr:DUF2283 domain-containing protein [Candidatus Amesbacteria bacterium]
MKIKYDKTTDSVYFHFNSSPYSHSKKITDGVVVDISKTGKPMGIEILDATKVIKGFNPAKIPSRYAI